MSAGQVPRDSLNPVFRGTPGGHEKDKWAGLHSKLGSPTAAPTAPYCVAKMNVWVSPSVNSAFSGVISTSARPRDLSEKAIVKIPLEIPERTQFCSDVDSAFPNGSYRTSLLYLIL